MIQANELRIDNYVYDYYWCNTKRSYCFDIIKLKKIASTYVVCCKDDAYCLDDIKPIPLTEELLLKCGFEKYSSLIIDSYDMILPMMIGIKKLTVTIQQGNQYIYLKEFDNESASHPEELVCLRNYDSHGLFMLHQLQNLYFALTGEELEINL